VALCLFAAMAMPFGLAVSGLVSAAIISGLCGARI
jgi:hypothetical protein